MPHPWLRGGRGPAQRPGAVPSSAETSAPPPGPQTPARRPLLRGYSGNEALGVSNSSLLLPTLREEPAGLFLGLHFVCLKCGCKRIFQMFPRMLSGAQRKLRGGGSVARRKAVCRGSPVRAVGPRAGVLGPLCPLDGSHRPTLESPLCLQEDRGSAVFPSKQPLPTQSGRLSASTRGPW